MCSFLLSFIFFFLPMGLFAGSKHFLTNDTFQLTRFGYSEITCCRMESTDKDSWNVICGLLSTEDDHHNLYQSILSLNMVSSKTEYCLGTLSKKFFLTQTQLHQVNVSVHKRKKAHGYALGLQCGLENSVLCVFFLFVCLSSPL